MRWFMLLAYRGRAFHGWQIQPDDISVQGRIEESLATLLRCQVPIVGAGRTDAGVNARMMVAHVDLPDGFNPADRRFILSLNSLCGPDIAIYSFTQVHAEAHARFDATERTYRYFVHSGKNPFTGDLSWQAPPSFNFDDMNRAAALLIGKRDFTSFSKLHTDTKTNICNLTRAQWIPMGGNRYYFEITADRFLRNMVRAVVGTLAIVGRGKMKPDEILNILEKKDRCAAGTSMPAQPLFLWDIKYPYYDATPSSLLP